MRKLVDLIVMALAAETVRRYVAEEHVGQPVRDAADKIDSHLWRICDGEPPWSLGMLFECDLCLRQWVTFVVVLAHRVPRLRWLVESAAVNGAVAAAKGE